MYKCFIIFSLIQNAERDISFSKLPDLDGLAQ